MNFVWKIFHDKSDEEVHRQFIRFGKGEYGGRVLLGLWRTAEKVKIKGSFELANDFVMLAARLGNVSFSGNIWSKEPLHGLDGKKKAGKWVYEVNNLPSSKIHELSKDAYYFLLNGNGQDIKLKIKSKLPKPGKGENKVDNKFCQLEIEGKYYKAAHEDFFWDIPPEAKKASIRHRFIITDIVLPKAGSKDADYALLREMAKRKGKIVRIAEVDGKEVRTEKNFEA